MLCKYLHYMCAHRLFPFHTGGVDMQGEWRRHTRPVHGSDQAHLYISRWLMAAEATLPAGGSAGSVAAFSHTALCQQTRRCLKEPNTTTAPHKVATRVNTMLVSLQTENGITHREISLFSAQTKLNVEDIIVVQKSNFDRKVPDTSCFAALHFPERGFVCCRWNISHTVTVTTELHWSNAAASWCHADVTM